MNTNEKNIWEHYADTQLRIWPEHNYALNLNGAQRKSVFMPQKIFNSVKGISMAPTLPIDVLDKFQILTMGIAIHTKGYYHSRINKSFYDIMIVVKGSLEVKGENIRVSLKKDDALILPPKLLCDSFVDKKNAEVVYLHLEDNRRWQSLLGKEIVTQKLKHANEIYCLLNLYTKEIYSNTPNLPLLENFAESIVLFLEKEFPQIEKSKKNFDIKNWVLNRNPKDLWKITDAANYFDTSKTGIEMACEKQYGLSFKKTVRNTLLQHSIDMIRQGKTNSEIAQLLGYSDAYAFSKAFKYKFGASP